MILKLDFFKVSKMTHNFSLSKVPKMSSLRINFKKANHLRSNHNEVPKTNNYKKNTFFVHSRKISNPLKDLKQSTEKLKEIATLLAKERNIKGYKSMSEDRLLSAFKESESLKESQNNFDDTKRKTNFSKARIEKIRKEFNESRYKFSKSRINKVRKNLYEMENEKNLFASKIKEIETNITELEENLSKTKKYYDYDDTEYKIIKM